MHRAPVTLLLPSYEAFPHTLERPCVLVWDSVKVKRHKAERERERERAGRRDKEQARHKVNTQQFTHRSTAYSHIQINTINLMLIMWSDCGILLQQRFTKIIKSWELISPIGWRRQQSAKILEAMWLKWFRHRRRIWRRQKQGNRPKTSESTTSPINVGPERRKDECGSTEASVCVSVVYRIQEVHLICAGCCMFCCNRGNIFFKR